VPVILLTIPKDVPVSPVFTETVPLVVEKSDPLPTICQVSVELLGAAPLKATATVSVDPDCIAAVVPPERVRLIEFVELESELLAFIDF